MKFRTNKFSQFWNIAKSEKNPISSLKIGKFLDFFFEKVENNAISSQIGFLSDFAKKVAKVPKLTKVIYSEFHLSQFSAKLKNLFREGGLYHGYRRGC